jgi:hypothetical protein
VVRAVLALGITQITAWGTSYYCLGVLAGPISQDTGWSRGFVFLGFTVALLAMGLGTPRHPPRFAWIVDPWGWPAARVSLLAAAAGPSQPLTIGLIWRRIPASREPRRLLAGARDPVLRHPRSTHRGKLHGTTRTVEGDPS